MIEVTNALRNWSLETRAAYLACAIDTDGWVGLRTLCRNDNTFRIYPHVGVTNQSIDLLKRLAVIADVPFNVSLNSHIGRDSRGIVTRASCWQCYWSSPIHVIRILEMAIPYLVAKQERAAWTLEYAKSRITANGCVARKAHPYTQRDWDLAEMVIAANGHGKFVHPPQITVEA